MNINALKQKFNSLTTGIKYSIYGIGGVVFIGIMILMIKVAHTQQEKPTSKKTRIEKKIKLDGVTTDFDSSNQMSALNASQLQLASLEKTVNKLTKTVNIQQQLSQKQQTEYETKIKELKNQVTGLSGILKKPSTNKSTLQNPNTKDKPLTLHMYGQSNANIKNNEYSLDNSRRLKQKGTPKSAIGNQISSFNFNFAVTKKNINEFDNMHYAPTGTFVKAVMLNGADAAAGMTTQGNAQPVLFRLLENGHAPNGKSIPLKGCFVTAGVTGDISSERGIIKLDRISCAKQDGSVLDIPVEGTAIDSGGKNGIRGIPVMRNGKVMMMSGLSGLLSGIGSAVNQSATTTSISPLGATLSSTGMDAVKAGAGKGIETAFSKISQYYIDLANQYHPIIQLNSGSMVDLVFLGGFSLNANQSKAIGFHKSLKYNNQGITKARSTNTQNQMALTKQAFQNFKIGK